MPSTSTSDRTPKYSCGNDQALETLKQLVNTIIVNNGRVICSQIHGKMNETELRGNEQHCNKIPDVQSIIEKTQKN